MESVRTGLGANPSWAWTAPILALLLVGVAQATNPSGDLRLGAFPWLVALAAAGLAYLSLSIVALHAPDSGRLVVIGGWWVALAFAGVTGFFVAVGVGEMFGIDPDSAGILSWIPLLSMAFGLLSMTPAMAILAVGAARAEVLPRWGVAAIWVEAPLLIILLIFGGLFDGTIETVGSSVLLGLAALGWIVIGLAVRTAVHRTARR